jgi:hypothetical protein
MVNKRQRQIQAWASKINTNEPPVVKELRAENKRLRDRLVVAGAKAELIVHAVQEALADYEPPVIPTPAKSPKRGQVEAAVCHLSDTQFGKVTKTYDSSIASQRVAEYTDRVIRCIRAHRHYAKVDELHLYLGGDMIEGEMIFPGQAHLIDQPVIDQATSSCPKALAACIIALAAEVRQIHVVCVAGNHGRPTSKHAGSHPKTNWDRVTYDVTKMMVGANSRIKWHIPDDFYAVHNVLGHGHLVVHGHQIRGGFAGFPFYGVGKKASGWIDSIEENWDHLYFGHFHTYTSGTLNGRFYFCNGTTESDNDYAREELAASGSPVQRLQFWNSEYGLVADRPIYLTSGLKK